MADVQIVAVQSDLQPLSQRVAYRAALWVVLTAFPAMVAVPMEVENGQPMQVDLATRHRAVRKPRTSQLCSLGLRRRCWCWRRHCR